MYNVAYCCGHAACGHAAARVRQAVAERTRSVTEAAPVGGRDGGEGASA